MTSLFSRQTIHVILFLDALDHGFRHDIDAMLRHFLVKGLANIFIKLPGARYRPARSQ